MAAAKTMSLSGQITDLFATHDDLASLQDYCEQMSGSERALAHTMVAIAVNTVLNVLSKEVQNGTNLTE